MSYPPENWYYGICSCHFRFYNPESDKLEERCLETSRRIDIESLMFDVDLEKYIISDLMKGHIYVDVTYTSCREVFVQVNYSGKVEFSGETQKDQINAKFELESDIKSRIYSQAYIVLSTAPPLI